MPSNINPTLAPTKSLDKFKFWCQKVLPLVYDDSLSYYEVLGKMVVQLNDVIDDINADTENVLTLKEAFDDLKDYVDNFFDDIEHLAEYAERAEAAQTAANSSAINAASSAVNASISSQAAMDARAAAQTAAQDATASKNDAVTAATTATTKAGEAAQSAINAQTAQASASQNAILADAARSAAQEFAENAASDAQDANNSADYAATSEQNVRDLVEDLPSDFTDLIADVNELKESIDYYDINKHIVINDMSFVKGTIAQTGNNQDSNFRARTDDYLAFNDSNGTISVTILDSTMQYSVRWYNAEDLTFLRGDTEWRSENANITVANNECIRFAVRKATNETITNANILKNIIRIEYDINNVPSTPLTNNFNSSEILCAKTVFYSDGTQPKELYYIVASPLTRILYKTNDFVNYTAICSVPFAFIDHYSFGVDYNDNIIAVFTVQCLNDPRIIGDDICRRNPFVFLKSENYSIAHEIMFNDGNAPTGWFNNSSFYTDKNMTLFCEYTRTCVATMNIWKITGDITNISNWIKKLTLTLSGENAGLKHFHCLQKDPFYNVFYASTGDDDNGAKTYYSTDNGDTWTILYEGTEMYSRYVNLVFTEEFIYWATDTSNVDRHYLFRTTRDSNNIMSFANITQLKDLNDQNDATYATIYLEALNKLFLAERADKLDKNWINIIVYDIASNTIINIKQLKSEVNRRLGFRCNYISYISRNNKVICGFTTYMSFHNGGYPNYFKVFGNKPSATPIPCINNLVLTFTENNVSIDFIK